MDLTTMTPVEIDTLLAPIWNDQALMEHALVQASRVVTRLRARADKVLKGEKVDDVRTPADGIRLMQTIEAERTAMSHLREELKGLEAKALPFENEYVRRGGWTRVFLAKSHNGHAHNGTECSTCHNGEYRTEFAWLIRYSGQSEEEIVADAGERACATCYPTAPVDAKGTKMFTPDEEEARRAREEREAAKAKRAADRTAKGITNPDGSPLRGRHGRLETERAAVLEATDELSERYTNRRADQLIEADAGLAPFLNPKDKRDRWEAEARGRALPLIEAIAHKRGETVEAVLAELEPKAYAKAKRDMGGDWAQRFRHNATWDLEAYNAYKATCEAEDRKPFEALTLRWAKF